MPLPMVHLGTAIEYSRDKSLSLKCPQFFLGSISPDAIHIRKEATRENKNITHLFAQKDNVIKFIKEKTNNLNYSFILGYGIHILTDIFWHDTVFSKFKLAYERDPAPTQEIRLAYYNDMDRLDFEIYKITEWRQEVWSLLEKSESCCVEDVLTSDEIMSWNNRTLHWYDSEESQHKNPVKYISIQEILEFTKSTSLKIKDILKVEGL